MLNKSLHDVKRDLAMLEIIKTEETLAREKIELAKYLSQKTKLDFDQSMDLVDMICDVTLAGYRGTSKIDFFRKEIRDRLIAKVIRRQERDQN